MPGGHGRETGYKTGGYRAGHGWLGATVIAVTVAFGAAAVVVSAPASADPTIESTYATAGPYTMTSTTATSAGNSYKIYYPTQLASLGFLSPIITWGNGTGSNGVPSTAKYDSELFPHLVSRGFTIIAYDAVDTGSGRAILAGAQYLVAQNSTPASPFYQRLDPSKVAAVGHSQGAGGATRVANDVSTGGQALIKTLVTFSLPWNGETHPPWDPNSTGWIGANSDCPTAADCMYYPSAITQPAFLIGTHGTADGVIANPTIEREYYDDIAGQAVLGLIQNSRYNTTSGIQTKVADHPSIQDSFSDGNPLDLLGYVTAWLMYRLRGDSYAAGAFTGANPEIVSNPNWPNSAAKP